MLGVTAMFIGLAACGEIGEGITLRVAGMVVGVS